MANKGVILELRKNEAILFSDMCEYVKIKRVDGMFVGQLVEYTVPKKNSKTGYIALITSVAAALMLIMGYNIVFHNLTSQVYAYIAIDINPSIEFSIDRNNNVISLVPLNSDAKKIAKHADVKGKPISEAVLYILSVLKDTGYVNPEAPNIVLLSASTAIVPGGSEPETAKESIDFRETIKAVKNSIENHQTLNFTVEVICVTPELRKASSEHHMSMGRYALYSNALGKGTAITESDAKNKPLSDLLIFLSNENNDLVNSQITVNTINGNSKNNVSSTEKAQIKANNKTALPASTPARPSDRSFAKKASEKVYKQSIMPTPLSTPAATPYTPTPIPTAAYTKKSTRNLYDKASEASVKPSRTSVSKSKFSPTPQPTATPIVAAPTVIRQTAVPAKSPFPIEPPHKPDELHEPDRDSIEPKKAKERELPNPVHDPIEPEIPKNIPGNPLENNHAPIPRKESLPMPDGNNSHTSPNNDALPLLEDGPKANPPENNMPFSPHYPQVTPRKH